MIAVFAYMIIYAKNHGNVSNNQKRNTKSTQGFKAANENILKDIKDHSYDHNELRITILQEIKPKNKWKF